MPLKRNYAKLFIQLAKALAAASEEEQRAFNDVMRRRCPPGTPPQEYNDILDKNATEPAPTGDLYIDVLKLIYNIKTREPAPFLREIGIRAAALTLHALQDAKFVNRMDLHDAERTIPAGSSNDSLWDFWCTVVVPSTAATQTDSRSTQQTADARMTEHFLSVLDLLSRQVDELKEQKSGEQGFEQQVRAIVKVLAKLQQQNRGEAVGKRAIARALQDKEGFSFNYLGALLPQIVSAGFITSERGCQGGYKMTSRAQELL